MLKTKTLDNIITEHEKITQFRIIACKGSKKKIFPKITLVLQTTQNKTKQKTLKKQTHKKLF